MESPASFTRMYADDTAMVLSNYKAELPVMEAIFTELAAAAHLELNIGKCIFIPLFDCSLDNIRSTISATTANFRDIVIAWTGKYLGYMIGPGKGDLSWQLAIDKAAKRVQDWDWAPLGLFFASVVWNIFIITVLGFVAQLECPPADIQDRMAKMLRRAGHGPGNWCHTD